VSAVPPIAAGVMAAAALEGCLHMPGHKRRLGALHPLAAELLGPAVTYDVSELGGFDYLHAPAGAIATAQASAAVLFGAGATFFLVNGATAGNQAALLAAAGESGRVAMFRASHRSVYAGVELSGATPRYLEGAFDPVTGLAGFPAADDLDRIDEPLDVVHVTRPTYYGSCVALAPYRRLADRCGALLVVDEAHGTHLAFDERLPVDGLAAGADVVIQSPHKTLGSLTQSALLHVRRGLDPAPFAHALGMLQSSSPNASLLVSLDLCLAHLAETHGAGVREAVTRALAARGRLASLPGVTLEGEGLVAGIDAHDPTKLVLDVSGRGLTGFDARDLLQAAGSWVEFADFRRVVGTVTFADDEPVLDAFVRAVEALPMRRGGVPPLPLPPHGPLELTPRQAASRPATSLPMERAASRVAADYLIPYPPGIPLVVPGERITAEVAAAVDGLRAAGCRVVGPSSPARIRVIEEP
jgi:arginine/lysine/ornithine decarboxylase